MITASGKTVVECAYELARSGDCRDLTEIRKKLIGAGFVGCHVDDHLQGKALRQQLRRLCQEAREPATADS